MMSIWGWIADAILALLLTATLVMAIRLDRALRIVRRDRAVFEALISNLSSTTHSVKLGIQALRSEADRAADQIERRSEDADKLATDLSFLIEAADRAGARLEEGRRAPPAYSAAKPTDDPSSEARHGLRQLTGIAKRRRSSSSGSSVSPQHTDLDSQNTDESMPPARSQETASTMVAAGGVR
jgi:hypothetical protein